MAIVSTQQGLQWPASAGGVRVAADARIPAERVVEGEVLGRAREHAVPPLAGAGFPAQRGLAAYLANVVEYSARPGAELARIDCYV